MASIIGWAFVIVMGLLVLWLFVRYVLPILVMLAVIGAASYVGWHMWTEPAHARAAQMAARPAVPAVTVRPTVRPTRPTRERHYLPGTEQYCARHPNAESCEDRD
jgi:hypothetical protein